MGKRRNPAGLEPVPDGLVVLTFDDGCRSDVEFVAPLLKTYGFGATFFCNDNVVSRSGWILEHYITWQQAAEFHAAGFEIGNHLADHLSVADLTGERLSEQLDKWERHCREHGIPIPVSFCYPGFTFDRAAVDVLAGRGYLFARRGTFPEYDYDLQGQRGPLYDPAVDHALLIPTAGFSGPHYRMEDLVWAVGRARGGRIAVLCFHGVPDLDHPWVTTPQDLFVRYMDHLRDTGCTVIAMRDLARYVDPSAGPADPIAAIERKPRCA